MLVFLKCALGLGPIFPSEIAIMIEKNSYCSQ